MMEERILQCIKNPKTKNDEMIKLLRDAGRTAARYITKDGTPFLNEAILSFNTAAAKFLLEKGADPCCKDANGQTALHAAAQVNNVSMLMELFQTCSIHTQDLDGNTPLHIAVRNTSIMMIKWLVFLGADPLVVNKNKEACRSLSKKNFVLQLLREFNPDRAAVRHLRLKESNASTLEGMPFSIQLAGPLSNRQSASHFVCTCCSTLSLPPEKLRLLKFKPDEEEGWGPAVEYRSTQEADVTLTFPINDLPPPMYQVVLRVVDTANETTYDVIPGISQAPSKSVNETIANDARAIALACAKLTLSESGLLLLVCQPVKQAIHLKEGARSVTSVIDDRVQLTMDDESKDFKGELQLEPSPPVHEAVLYNAPVAREVEIQSQTDFVTMATTRKDSVGSCSVTIEMPLPNDYGGGPLRIFLRSQSTDSDVVDSGYAKRELELREDYYTCKKKRSYSLTSQSSYESEDDSEVEQESGCWEINHIVSPQPVAKNIRVPVVANKTMTVVEASTKHVSDRKQKWGVARQYLKRQDRKCFFFVAARELESWRECHEVLVAVASPSHKAAEFERHLTERYCLLHVSAEFLTRPPTRFLLSVLGNMPMLTGEREASVTFRQVFRQNDTTNRALFTVRCTSRDELSQGRISIHQERKGARKKEPWSYKGDLRFDLTRIEQVWRLGEQETTYPFTDQLLLNLVNQLYVSESKELGIQLGLTDSHVDRIMSNDHLKTPVIKCFEILRRKRDSCEKMVQFGRSLVAALGIMEWNRQCEWLMEQLADWPQRAEIEPQEGT